MDNYKITQYSVNHILNFVQGDQIAIPEIQRPFVWKGREVRDLIDSLYEGYPIGYLIVWQNTQVRLKGFGKGGTKKILIDGQQRVTALMAALTGREVLDEHYRSYRIRIGFNPLAGEEEEHFTVWDGSLEDDPRWIPDISVLFARDYSFRTFEKEYKDRNPGQDFSKLEEAVDTLRGITKHQVGVIELSFLLDIDVVSEIFIRINLQGKPLNQEDFAMSKISVNEQYDGDYIRNCIDYFCHLLKEPSFFADLKQNEPDFLASPYGKALSWCTGGADEIYVPAYTDVLKVVLISYFGKSKIGDLVNLLSGKTKKRGVISKKLTKDSFKTLGEGVRAFVEEKNYKGFCKALRSAGYGSSRLIYSQSVMNYCYAMYLLMGRQGLSEEEKASLIGKWMTFVLITGHYQGAPDSVVVRDYENVLAEGAASYMDQLAELRLTGDFFDGVLPAKYASTSSRSAAFIAYLASLCARGANALYSPDTAFAQVYAGKGESSQILPKAYLAKCGFKTREIYGQTANLIYLTAETRQLIRRREPAAYKDALEEALGKDAVMASLKAHDMDESLFAVTEKEVESFFEGRRKAMAKAVETYYRSL